MPAKLEEALRELGVSPVQHAEGVMTLDDFKRVARQLSEAEQWIQMIPLAGLLARAFRKRDLDGLENLQPDEVASGFEAFSSAATAMVETRLRKLKDQKQKLRDLPSDDSKFGGQLEGGNVEDFHRGLADRLGNSSFHMMCLLSFEMYGAQDTHTRSSRRAWKTSTATRALGATWNSRPQTTISRLHRKESSRSRRIQRNARKKTRKTRIGRRLCGT